MDAIDRQMMIERLQAANAESAAEIERRREQRESDPAGHDRAEREHNAAVVSHDTLRGEEWAGAIRDAPVQKLGSDELVYRRHENNEQTSAAASLRTEIFAADPPAEDEFETAIDKFSEATANALADDARRIVALERELVTRDAKIARLEGKLDMLCQLLGTDTARKKLWTPGDGMD